MRLKDFKKNIQFVRIGDFYEIQFRAFVPIYNHEGLVEYRFRYQFYREQHLSVGYLVHRVKSQIVAEIQNIFWLYNATSKEGFEHIKYPEQLTPREYELILKPKHLKLLANEYLGR